MKSVLPEGFNQLASPAGIEELTRDYSKILDDILSFRKSKQHRPLSVSPLSDVKRGVLEALSECSNRKFAPPVALVRLIERLFESAPDDQKRIKGAIKNRDLLRKAAEMHVQTGLVGRPLAQALRKNGINAADRTIQTYCDSKQFKTLVESLRK